MILPLARVLFRDQRRHSLWDGIALSCYGYAVWGREEPRIILPDRSSSPSFADRRVAPPSRSRLPFGIWALGWDAASRRGYSRYPLPPRQTRESPPIPNFLGKSPKVEYSVRNYLLFRKCQTRKNWISALHNVLTSPIMWCIVWPWMTHKSAAAQRFCRHSFCAVWIAFRQSSYRFFVF